MRLTRLPGWSTDNETSVRKEVAPLVHASPSERWLATQRCAHAARKMLAFHHDPERALQHRDPLPPSSIDALTRLRAQ